MSKQSLSSGSSLLEPFLGVAVSMETPLGRVSGALRVFEKSLHGGAGAFLLETCEGWMLVNV